MFSQQILNWFDSNKRDLPWRVEPRNPYYTWLSEIMLQQTTVGTVIPYFHQFIQKWPTLSSLASASLDDVLILWQGLGYYSRARNLHKCALHLSKEFPSSEAELLKLPGIGPYTAAAIASIAFQQRAVAVDGNVIRVMARYLALSKPKPVDEVRKALFLLLPKSRYGDFTEGLMELGALICRPKNPLCQNCPIQKGCKAYRLKKMDTYPIKQIKTKLPTRYAQAFIITRKDGAILLRKRPPKGLLAGMMEVPTTPWEEKEIKGKGPMIQHTFTHFHFKAHIRHTTDQLSYEGIWVHPKDLHLYPLPTVMKKIIREGLKELE